MPFSCSTNLLARSGTPRLVARAHSIHDFISLSTRDFSNRCVMIHCVEGLKCSAIKDFLYLPKTLDLDLDWPLLGRPYISLEQWNAEWCRRVSTNLVNQIEI